MVIFCFSLFYIIINCIFLCVELLKSISSWCNASIRSTNCRRKHIKILRLHWYRLAFFMSGHHAAITSAVPEPNQRDYFLFPTLPHLLWLIHTLFCCALGLYSGRLVVVGAECYFYCKPHCNNSMRNLMKVELATVPRPPASSGWRSPKQRLLEVASYPARGRGILRRYV